MIYNYLNKILLIVLLMTVFVYAKNKNLLQFKDISIKGNNLIDADLLLNYVSYNPDSLQFYSKKEINKFCSKFQSLKDKKLIRNIKFSYSLPNKIIVSIDEYKPAFLLKNNVNDFILDHNGQIINTDLLSFYKTENRNITELDLDTYNYTGSSNKSSKDLLNIFEILTWFNEKKFNAKMDSIIISDKNIKINLNETRILFNKDIDIDKQISRINFLTTKRLKDSLNIDNISDFEYINLSFSNQTVIKLKEAK